VFECIETRQRFGIRMSGQGVQPLLEFSKTHFRFGEACVGERRDQIVTIKNVGDALPLNFALNRVANFQARPQQGRLAPLQSQTVILSFIPKQLGAFDTPMKCVVGKGLYTSTLRVSGSASGGTSPVKKTLKRGPMATAKDFEPEFHFMPEGTDGDFPSGASKPFTRTAPWTRELTVEEVDMQHPLYTLTMEEMAAKAEHKHAYSAYLADARATRMSRKKGGQPPPPDGVDLGMEPRLGLDEPEPAMLSKAEPLWLERPMGGEVPYAKKRAAAKKLVHDPMRHVKKKFKPRPTSQVEKRDCEATLSPKDLALVSAGPKAVEYGTVSVGSTTRRCFTVVNGVDQMIHVSIHPERHTELALSSPLSQVIPPGGTGGFDIMFSPTVEGDFASSVKYSVNGQHSFNFSISAHVVPPCVELSTTEMRFAFGGDNLNPSVTKSLTLTNPGNAPVEVEASPLPAFHCEPQTLTLPARGSQDVEVTFDPTYGAPSEDMLLLAVTGGETMEVSLQGDAPEVNLSFVERRCDLGPLPTGIARGKELNLRNSGTSPAVFWVEKSALPEGVEVMPARGRILVGETQTLKVTLLAPLPTVYAPPSSGVKA
jgi:hypothetical protein